MEFQIIWFILWAVLWAAFFMLEGFDFGAGILHSILGRNETEKGMIMDEFKGKIGTVIAKRGSSYILQVSDGNAIKKVISRPEHLKPI